MIELMLTLRLNVWRYFNVDQRCTISVLSGMCASAHNINFINVSLLVGCRNDNECPLIQSCINNECIDTCLVTQCGINALCTADGYHKTRCYCPDGYIGNPYEVCERPECTSDNDCPLFLACRNLKCVNPCNCPPPALCTVLNHRSVCKCPPGYMGNPYSLCLMGNSPFLIL